jgi:D-lactate dehydrogenase (cytochrome)
MSITLFGYFLANIFRVLSTVAVCHFPDVRKATEAVIDVLNQGVGIRTFSFLSCIFNLIWYYTECAELLDDVLMQATNTFGQSGRTWPVKDTIFFKLQGQSKASLEESAKVLKEVTKKHGGFGFQLAKNEQDANAIWLDRKNAHYSGLSLVPGSRPIATDVW